MTGIIDVATSMEQKKLHMGYRTIGLDGHTIKGHEFHYSQLVESAEQAAISEVYNARSERVEAPVFYTPRLLASYMHFYWAEDTTLLETWMGLSGG